MNPLPDTFNNPQLWPLLLFAILPALLYFIDRRRARRIDWPALRFFLLPKPNSIEGGKHCTPIRKLSSNAV